MPTTPRPTRRILAATLSAAVLIAAAYPCLWLTLLAHRELLRAAAAIGLLDTSRGLGGQILRYNYPRHPEWVHPILAAAAASLGYALPLLVAALLYRAIAKPPRQRALILAARLLILIAIFGALRGYLTRAHSHTIQNTVLAAAESRGHTVTRISGIVPMTESGPMNGPHAAFWNTAYRHAPWILIWTAATAAAFTTHYLTARLTPTRPTTGCPNCGYPTDTIQSSRCPECGASLKR